MAKITDRFGRPTAGVMPGLVEAIVDKNDEDPAGIGRVRVRFPSLPDTPGSYWARLVTPMAGKDRGWVSIPEVDDEVLVAFLHGDIQHAIVVGALFNGKDLPPYANKDGDNNIRMFKSRSGHTVTFDDTSGGEKIEMVTSGEAVKVVYDAANKKLSVTCSGDIEMEAKKGFKVTCQDFDVSAKAGVKLEAKGDAKLSGASATIEGKAKVGLAAPAISLG
jgi:uncharacterized protein involved in type VI secretion and phage assembly